jgi:hypothetical protein
VNHECFPAANSTDNPSATIVERGPHIAVISMTPDSETSGTQARRPWWVGLPILLVIALYTLPLADAPAVTNPNEVVRIELATSIAFWARFDLEDSAAIYGLSEDVSIRDGKLYSDKAPGLSMISVPFVWIVNPILGRAPSSDLPAYWPLRHALTMLLLALPTVGLAFLVGAAVPEIDPKHRTAYALIAALTTPLWTYGTVYFGHASAALLITVAWFLLLGFPGQRSPLGPRQAALGGAVAGFSVATEYPTALLVAVIFATLLVRRISLLVLVSAAAGAFAGALPALIYHQIAFGAPWITGYSFKAASDFQAIIAHGAYGISWPSAEALWGISFGARRGVFYYCPLLLLMPLGLWQMVRQGGWRDAGPILTATASYVLFAAGFVDWQAGWCAAARHLVPILPLAIAIALSAAAKLSEHRWGATIVVILISISGTNALLTIALTPYFPPEFGAPLAQLVLPSLADGAGFSNLLSSGFGIAQVYVVILIGMVAIAALIWATGRLVRDTKIWLPAISLTTVAVLLLTYSWQGSAPNAETELMRSQVLRRLGHTAVADQIEDSLLSAATPAAD